jgi:hypothetical protein
MDCPLCGGWASVRDHDHDTNLFRGYICHGCNIRMGQFDNGDLDDRIEHMQEELTELLAWRDKARVFKGRKIVHSGWFDEKGGGIAFYLDVAVLKGWLQRV